MSFCDTGVEISRSYSPESASDSGNETNSSEMTESSELAGAQKLSDNPLKMFVATAEGYQTLDAEKTEFRLRATSRNQEEELKSTAVASCQALHSDHLEMEPETMETKSLSDYFNKMHMDAMMGKGQGKVDEGDCRLGIASKNESSQIKTIGSNVGDVVGRYNNVNSREPLHTGFDFQRTTFPLQDKNPRSQQILNCKSEEHIHSKTPKCGSSNTIAPSNLRGSLMDLNTRSAADEAYLIDQATHEQQSKVPSSEKEVTRLYGYHLLKRMSSLQSEGIHSLQSSQCSSIDAGCSTGSSSCVTPMDSPLCTAENIHLITESSLKGLGYPNSEEKGYSQSPHRKLVHQTLDPAFLRKHHATPGTESSMGREGCQRVAKIRETTGIFYKILAPFLKTKLYSCVAS